MVKIKKVILWSLNDERREIDFNVDGITLLIGKSKAGKTALISIIDYCLASSDCEIPAGLIRDCCSWYGLVLKINDSEVLIARKSPIDAQKSDEMYFEVLQKSLIPNHLKANRTRNEIKNYFNELFKITNLILDESIYTRDYIPSYRDTIAINFFPQDLLLSKDYYFYKQNKQIHDENLKMMFPFMMELISIKDILTQRKIKELKRNVKLLEKEIERNVKVLNKWEIDSEAKILKAIEYGLLNCDSIPGEFLERISLLKTIDEQSFTNRIDNIKKSIYTLESEVTRYEDKESEIYSKINIVTNKLSLIKKQIKQIYEYEEYQNRKIQTKKVTEWMLKDEYLLNNIEKTNDSYSYKIYDKILNTLEREEKGILFYDNLRVSLDNEYIKYEKELNDLINELKLTTEILLSYNSSDENLLNKRDFLFKIYSFYGELENYIRIYDIMIDSTTTFDKINNLKREIELEEAKLNKEVLKEKKENFELFMNGTLETILDTLNVEHKGEKVTFDSKNIDLLFKIGKNKISLNKIGSGSNYVEYHVAMALLISIYIQSKVKNKCTFDFIVFDQPSEAYFPTKEENIDAKEKNTENDATNLKALYKTIINIRKYHCPNTQIIILEHAGKEYWEDSRDQLIDCNIKIIDWKENEEKLIPESWVKS